MVRTENLTRTALKIKIKKEQGYSLIAEGLHTTYLVSIPSTAINK